ncbi:MAG: methionine synthase [Clostridia bacterium]|nr:methionine synthase [Clostridia bacterium]
MNEVVTLRNLHPSYNKGLILTRLGHDKLKTKLPEKVEEEFERLLSKAEQTLCLTAAYRVMSIEKVEASKIYLEDGTVFCGSGLAKLMEGCNQALLMLATGGKRIMELINELQRDGRMSEAVVIDAAASEITDSALDVVMAHMAQKLMPRARTLTRMRYSPGYGDFDITQQAAFYRLLEAQKYDLALNDAFLLIPEKSVFAIAGIAGGK